MKQFSPTSQRRRVGARLLPLALLIVVPLAFLSKGCTSTLPNRNPVGESFPIVSGESLEKEKLEIPSAFAGEPAILLVGYLQGTQFDIDRWIMGLLQADVSARIVEIPTLPGLATSLASGWIDDGMRSGIPKEDWGAVVTLYGDSASPVAKLTGTESGRRARVIVLDPSGEIVWFDDEGYSATKAMAVAELVAGM
jgi:hypothetical protein